MTSFTDDQAALPLLRNTMNPIPELAEQILNRTSDDDNDGIDYAITNSMLSITDIPPEIPINRFPFTTFNFHDEEDENLFDSPSKIRDTLIMTLGLEYYHFLPSGQVNHDILSAQNVIHFLSNTKKLERSKPI